MEKIGIISRHIIICESSAPIYGIILLKDEHIQDIIMLDSAISPESAISKFAQWKILDFSDSYISPGIIDLNARKEWESYSAFTRSAISGGTTFILEEPSFYSDQAETGELYCDVGRTKLLTNENMHETDSECLAYKAYLYQPTANIQAVSDLEGLIALSTCSNTTVLIDPNFPDPRMHYMASPNRLESTEDHKSNESHRSTEIFAAAFPQSTLDSSDSASDELDEENRTVSLMENEIQSFKSENVFGIGEDIVRYSKGGEVVRSGNPALLKVAKGEKRRKRSGSRTLMEGVDQQIKEDQNKIEILCSAESNTYKLAGSTKFVVPEVEKTPERKFDIRKKLGNLKISTKSKAELAPDYTFFLANCPVCWETSGIEMVLAKTHEKSRIHFQNISSAASFNLIRQATESKKHITCEISGAHLFFNSGNIPKNDTRYKSCPPIRNTSNFNLIWDLLKMREINSISSHHILIDYEHKAIDTCSFQNALNGICSMGFILQAVWSTINIPTSKFETLEHYLVRISKWLSLIPAKIIGLTHRGSIAKGKFADLIVWNPYCKSVARVCEDYQRLCTFNGLEMHGRIEKVFLRGRLAFDNGEFYPIGKRVNNKES